VFVLLDDCDGGFGWGLGEKKRVLYCGDTVRRDTAESVMRRWRVRQGYSGTAV